VSPDSANGHASPLRVLYLVDHARTVGGAERFVAGLATSVPRDKVEPWVCSTRYGHHPALTQLAAAGVPHVGLGRTGTWQLQRFLPLVRLLRRKRFDVVHANMFGSNLWGALLGRACRVPVVLAHEHTWSFAGDALRIWLDRHVIATLATRLIAVSQADRERMISIEGVPEEKVVVMPLAHVPHSDPTTGNIRSELGLKTNTPLVAVAAVMRPQKALEVMLDAHALMLERVPDAHLAIAGDGPCRAQLVEHVNRLGIRDSVHLLGIREDVDAILRAADVAAMSSDYEGVPLFALECINAGTPLVATAVGGLPEVIDEGRTGLLVPPRDPVALAQAIERVLTDRPLALTLANALERKRDDISLESVAHRFAELYEELVTEAKAA
jgi:glycosyltransferase involved in cell wall biosynthesis